MTRVVLVLEEALAAAIAPELAAEGVAEIARVAPEHVAATISCAAAPDAAAAAAFDGATAVVLPAIAGILTSDAVAFADRQGIRLVPVGDDSAAARLAAAFGLAAPVPSVWSPRDIARAVLAAQPPAPELAPAPAPRTIVVWGPHGSPGRTTLAIALATELARGGRHVALVDADSHAPAVAMTLGLPDEGPGFPVACRQAERGTLDDVELHRISVPLGGVDVDVFAGINRPSRWPELSAVRVSRALAACAGWADHTVVDVAASLEQDEEIVSDIVDGPRRNAATLAAVASADHIVAVLSADPVGVARFLRAYPDLRALAGTTPVSVVVNRLRGGTVGVDARGQIRRTLDRYADIRDLWFVPEDRRGMDAAMLAARPVAEVAPRSTLVAAVRRMVGAELVPPAPASADLSRRARRRSAPRRAPRGALVDV
ncbi:ParA family protein [Microbacterium sp. cx-59]|uniref:AAA family ATPase n=1 Tax=Microbacterium sp. cx-59 TaxID=2891207 RepID=UPI001E358DCD|nr:ParA family protein [Microbacterium sp. cx-59]MCC4909591.1 ParA family protein [Microbacterium sp. cx-59]